MIRIIPLRVIKGTVFLDTNNNDKKDGSEHVLKNIVIKLFHSEKMNSYNTDGNNKNIELYRKKFVRKVKTNEKGEYRFRVEEGRYSVSLDIDSLPAGKGIISTDKIVDMDHELNLDFAVKDVHTIQLGNFNKELIPGDSFSLNPLAKDSKGNNLTAKIDYLCDSDEVGVCSNRFISKSIVPNRNNITIKVSCGSITKEVPIKVKSPDRMSVEELRTAHSKNIIDEKTKIIHYLNLLFKNRKADQNTSVKPIKSCTTAIKEIQDYIGSRNADENIVKDAERYIRLSIPDLDKSYTSASGYFKIHYTLEGKHAVSKSNIGAGGVPRYIKSIAESFEYVKRVTCDSRGFRNPILGEGKNSFDIYVYDLDGKYGVTMSTSYYEMTSSKQRRASCNISIDNNYSPSKGFKDSRDNCMRVTAAHEFFHAVQYAYNVDADSWWKEASATWNEDEIYDDVDDYVRYIDRVFNSPEKSLEESSYGGVIFAKYLSENLGGYEVIKRIWEVQGIAYDTSVKAIDAVVKELHQDKDIAAVFNDYAACNFNPSQYYSEGVSWRKSVSIENTFTDYPVSVKSNALNHLASSYQLFKPLAHQENKALKISVSGAKNSKWGFKIQRRKMSDNLCSTTEIVMDGVVNRAEIILKDFGTTYSEICLIPSNLEQNRDSIPYMYSASIE